MSDRYQDEESEGNKWWPWAAGAGAVVLVGALVFSLMSPSKPPAPKTTTMHVVLPPPPPPPKKPKEPEPVPKSEPVKNDALPSAKPLENKAPDKPAQAPAGPKLTAAAGAGANAYGLAAGNGGGGSIGGGGGGGGGGGSRFGAYAGQIQAQVEAALRRDERTRAGQYLLNIRIWLSPSGQIIKVQMASSSGNQAIDQAIEAAIASVSVGHPPPADMPQPVNLRVRARAG